MRSGKLKDCFTLFFIFSLILFQGCDTNYANNDIKKEDIDVPDNIILCIDDGFSYADKAGVYKVTPRCVNSDFIDSENRWGASLIDLEGKYQWTDHQTIDNVESAVFPQITGLYYDNCLRRVYYSDIDIPLYDEDFRNYIIEAREMITCVDSDDVCNDLISCLGVNKDDYSEQVFKFQRSDGKNEYIISENIDGIDLFGLSFPLNPVKLYNENRIIRWGDYNGYFDIWSNFPNGSDGGEHPMPMFVFMNDLGDYSAIDLTYYDIIDTVSEDLSIINWETCMNDMVSCLISNNHSLTVVSHVGLYYIPLRICTEGEEVIFTNDFYLVPVWAFFYTYYDGGPMGDMNNSVIFNACTGELIFEGD